MKTHFARWSQSNKIQKIISYHQQWNRSRTNIECAELIHLQLNSSGCTKIQECVVRQAYRSEMMKYYTLEVEVSHTTRT